MNVFPLIKTKWSNEHLMAAVIVVLSLYHLPQWVKNPVGILSYLALVSFGLMIDAIACFIKYRRMWCCVSGGVTAAMVSLLTDGIPLWGKLVGVALALVLGKHLLGGTGRNLLNPAVIGVMLILPYFGIPEAYFKPSILLLPAILLSVAFLTIRPYAGIAFMFGMVIGMLIKHELSMEHILAYGVLFWGCLVITDPVTVSPHPIAGGVLGLLSGGLPVLLMDSPTMIVFGVLAINLFSHDLAKLIDKSPSTLRAKFRIVKVFPHEARMVEMIDMTQEAEHTISNINNTKVLKKEEIINRIQTNQVFGMGGAAYPTYQKLLAFIEADVPEKHLILNGVECDPGLIHDEWICRNHYDELCKGVELIKRCCKLTSVTLAVKEKEGLSEDKLRVHQVRDLYPIGAEKILMKEVLGIELQRDQIPAKEGYLVLNVQTVYTMCEAVLENKVVTTRFLTVANLRIMAAKVVKVDLGMKLSEIVEAIYPGAVTIFAGGGLMQSKLVEEDATVDPYVNFIATGLLPGYKESPQCSGCGNCRKYCPSNLQVKKIADLVDQNSFEETVKLRVKECINCGSCTYSCLAGNNLAAKIKRAKEAVAS